MILKVMENFNLPSSRDKDLRTFELIDGVRSFRVDRVASGSPSQVGAVNFNYRILRNPDAEPKVVLFCTMKDSSSVSVAFDTVCYVLNDFGKTVEVIYA